MHAPTKTAACASQTPTQPSRGIFAEWPHHDWPHRHGCLVRQSEIVVWSSSGQAGSLVEPAGAGLMVSSPQVPAQVVFQVVPAAGE
jgi:hypothetical protein